MEIDKILDDNLILNYLKAESKIQVLEKLSEVLKENEYISEVDGFVKDVLEREKLGVTGIGNFVAIPHGQSDYVNETTIAIGKLNKEIEWESLDNNGVRIVILFVVKNDKNFADEHLKLLSKVASNLANEDILKKLLSADSKEEIKNCFRS